MLSFCSVCRMYFADVILFFVVCVRLVGMCLLQHATVNVCDMSMMARRIRLRWI